jgi:hypothetical protein
MTVSWWHCSKARQRTWGRSFHSAGVFRINGGVSRIYRVVRQIGAEVVIRPAMGFATALHICRRSPIAKRGDHRRRRQAELEGTPLVIGSGTATG